MGAFAESDSESHLTTSLFTTKNALVVVGAWLLWHVLKTLYNVSPFHPLSHIPGPKLAAATYLYEFYYDVILFGQFTKRIKAMHEKYGPIVRINPDELHNNDAAFSEEIFPFGTRKRNKLAHIMHASALDTSGLATLDHDLHRTRRGPLAKFFSRNMLAQVEDDVHDAAQKLCDKMLSFAGRDPFDLTVAYSCFAVDVIAKYSFGTSLGFVDQEGWSPNFREPTEALLKPIFMFRFFPFLKKLDVVSTWFIDYLPRDLALLVRTAKIDVPRMIEKARADLDAGITFEKPTIFQSLLESDELPPEEKTTSRLADDGFAVLAAGTETSSWAMSVITYHLLTRPEILSKLTEEVRQVVPDPRHLPSWTVLEKIPYLSAVIHEGLRLSYGVSTRTGRIAPDEDLVYKGEFQKKPVEYVVPRGYSVSMSPYISHHDEAVFPDSMRFQPERWLDEKHQRRKEAERGFFSFSRGPRACVGMNLAMCELHLLVSILVLRGYPHMELYETTEERVQFGYDLFVPQPVDGQGPRVRMV